MRFEEWIETTSLPSTAKEQLPSVLGETTKRRLLDRVDSEELINAAIDEINRGSIETIEKLVNKIMGK